LPVDHTPHEIAVHARDTGGAEPSVPALPLRLIVPRKSAEATEAERKRPRHAAAREQRQLDPRSLGAAEFVMLAPSLRETDAAEDIFDGYGPRWQVELAIKRMKSLIHTDELPTRTPEASRSWLLSHLLLATLTDEMTQDLLDSFPCGPE
jgi:IS4 transposase